MSNFATQLRRGAGLALALLFAPLAAQAEPPATAIMVQVKCKPGATEQWLADFEKEIVPSIQDAIAKGDIYTGYTYYESVLPAQPYDFVLVYEAKSVAGLDAKRPAPHFAALFRRVGPVRAQQILNEMQSLEAGATVTIVRAHHGQK